MDLFSNFIGSLDGLVGFFHRAHSLDGIPARGESVSVLDTKQLQKLPIYSRPLAVTAAKAYYISFSKRK